MLGGTNTVDTVAMSHGKLYRYVNLQNISVTLSFNFKIQHVIILGKKCVCFPT